MMKIDDEIFHSHASRFLYDENSYPVKWTVRDEINDILDKLENYEEQHGMIEAPGELVRELRALVRRLE